MKSRVRKGLKEKGIERYEKFLDMFIA